MLGDRIVDLELRESGNAIRRYRCPNNIPRAGVEVDGDITIDFPEEVDHDREDAHVD